MAIFLPQQLIHCGFIQGGWTGFRAREQKHSHSSGGTKDQEQDPNLKEFQKSTLRYANLKLGPSTSKQGQEPKLLSEQNVRGIRFHVRSLGWVEMEDADLSPGKSSLAVNNCIRQLSYRKNDIRDTAGIWGEGKDMYMVLEDEYLKLTDPNDSTILNSQHVCSIRVWGVGRDNGRDFAYVARDKVTKRYKCHVFRCDIPAKAIANALHEICAKVMSERQKGNTISMVTQGQMIRQQQQQQLMQMKSISLDSSKDATHTPSAGVDFPTPKMEPITVFRANYVGSTSALKQSGMDVLNDAIDKVVGMVSEDQWTPVRIEVAVSTVTVTSVKTKETVAENRIRFMSFLGIGKDSRHFAYIMCIGKNKFQCHVFTCEHSAGGLAKAVEAACKLRYQKCLDANPKGSQVNAADGKTWGCALKTGIQSIFTKFGTIRIQGKDAPISAV
ncbi:amyloid beta precursor protein binding family B member 2-like [Lytechinus pictus]|uniref:amyloid beta precursor protein binding family B member 2-like n=1 Tax=Lytechinus pictus TaxID=7653 RepID=UPI00240E7216|nr:amyloid beta precursor protein binding family B member 2-like [Lytechinus pictus]